jgi:hypothetical protein
MIRWLKTHVTRDMVRPLIYKVFTRGVLALFAAQLVHFFAPADWPAARHGNLALILGILFLLGVFISWLRLDGMSIPQLKMPRRKRKDPFSTGDMADHIDDDIVKFDDLDKEEQDICVLLTDLILAVICLGFALFL